MLPRPLGVGILHFKDFFWLCGIFLELDALKLQQEISII